MRPPPAHRATTANLQALYPFVSEGGLEAQGPLVGRDLLGGSFHFDPWFLYGEGVLTNPNLMVLGQLGRGKSTFVKTFVWRQVAFGRQAWIVDPKGEYAPLVDACGGVRLRLLPGGQLRLNPLDLQPLNAERSRRGGAMLDFESVVRRRHELTCSLVSSSLGRQLGPAERTAIELAVRSSSRRESQPTLRSVVSALLDPDADLACSVHTDVAGLAADGREAALELRRLVEGDLAGMFDAPTSRDMDLDALVVVVDLSAVFASAALPVIMTSACAWLQAVLSCDQGLPAGRSAGRLVVVDEAWAILHDLSTARWMQSVFKLSRAFGVANLAVVHRLSDLRSAGAAGSAQHKLAEGLLADSETRVVFGQPASEAADTAELLGLSRTERDLLPALPRGVALWKVGTRSFLVEHSVGNMERALVDTDNAMRRPCR